MQVYRSPAGDQRSTGALGHAPKGRHILLEYYHIPGHLFAPLTDTARLRHALTVLIQQSGMTYLGNTCHVFEGTEGVTCVFLLSESHISIHTWPEHGYAALDIFTCGVSAHPEVMEQGLQELLQPGLVLRQEQPRGGLNTSLLSPEQRTAKVPVLHSTSSRYQSLSVVEVPGQLGSTAQGHVTCRKSLLQPATRVSGAATAGASNGSTADLGGCLGPQQTKARVLLVVADASKLHSVPFYAALHQLAKPQAALIQIVEIYMRVFEKDFAAMEAALQGAGWAGVGRSSVFTPSYGGEALMLHAVKR
ncbi:S-adenosylmethionine decarboxylase-domain-containing protein [Scenedesmus sp. NREL 46B-D3]|nr:S-adenosylmethionine decarboxylase-domain-containing protein [Scenedesmus sp. NREL 46B-D3]